MRMKHALFFGAVGMVFFSSCLKKEITDFAGVKLNPTLAFPLGKLHVVLGNILSDQDSLLTTNSDNSLSLKYRRDSAIYLSFKDIATEITSNWSASLDQQEAIGKVTLAPVSEQRSITLGELMNNFSDPAISTLILGMAGNMGTIPPFSGTSTIPFAIPTPSSFSQIQIDTAQLTLTLVNELPFDLQQITLALVDLENNETITLPPFNVSTGQMQSIQYQIVQKTLHDNLALRITYIESSGSTGPALIDLNDQLKLSISLESILISSRLVQIPMLHLEHNAFFEIQTDNDARISWLTFGDNTAIQYTLSSSLSFPVQVQYTLPSATLGGSPVQQVIQLPAQGQVSQSIDLSGAQIDLSQDTDQPYNRIPLSVAINALPPTNQQVVFDANDGIHIQLNFAQLEITQAQGYFGQVEKQIAPDEITLDLDLSFIDASNNPIFFESPSLTLEYENSFGFPLEVQLELTAYGPQGQTSLLNAPSLIFDYPPLSQAGQPLYSAIVINKYNSNLVDLLSIYPNRFAYSSSGRINPQGNQGMINYVLPNSYLLIHATFDLPLYLRATQITVYDTLSLTPKDSLVGKIRQADIQLDYLNGFPFEATMDLIDLTTDILLTSGITLPAASVNGNGRVQAVQTGRQTITLTADQADVLFQSSQILARIQIASYQQGQIPVALYTDYQIDIGVGIKAALELEQGF